MELLNGIVDGTGMFRETLLRFTSLMDDEFGTGFMGAVTDTEGLRVTHMLYADD